MHPIERELCKAVQFKPEPKARRDRTLETLVRRVSKLPDEDWEKLSHEAQTWSNAGADAVDKGEKIIDFEGEREKRLAKPKKKTKVKTSKKKKPPKPKPPKADIHSRLARAAAPSAQTLMKQLILRKLDITTDEMIAELNKAGYHPTRYVVSSLRGTFFHSLKVLRDEGWLNKKGTF
jgi:hypothetical protein